MSQPCGIVLGRLVVSVVVVAVLVVAWTAIIAPRTGTATTRLHCLEAGFKRGFIGDWNTAGSSRSRTMILGTSSGREGDERTNKFLSK